MPAENITTESSWEHRLQYDRFHTTPNKN